MVPIIQQVFAFLLNPTVVASLATHRASIIDNIIDGNIHHNAVKNLSAKFPPLSLPIIAINEFGSKNRALWPEVASKVDAVKYEAKERIGG